MSFYSEENPNISEKVDLDPSTNCGAESEFAAIGNDLKQSGGSTSLSTISDRHLISRNKLFEKEAWKVKSQEEKRRN